MVRQLGLIAAVAVLALFAGVAVAGLPTSVVSDVVVSGRSVPTIAAAPTSARPATTSAVTPSTPAPTTVEPTLRRTTTTPPPATTVAPSITAPPARLVAPADLNIVVANASRADGLAAETAAQLRAMGYPRVDATTSVDRRRTSAVYFTEGLEREAQRLADDLGVPGVVVRPPGPLTVDNAGGQLLVVVGGDRD